MAGVGPPRRPCDGPRRAGRGRRAARTYIVHSAVTRRNHGNLHRAAIRHSDAALTFIANSVMRLPARQVTRVVWEECMFLAPQHFQAQRHHFEETLGHTIEALFPFGYGVTSAMLDADALGGGTLALSHARGIFPDGTPVAVPEADRAPVPTSLAERFSPARDAHTVLLTLPGWRSDAPTLTP